jgi:aldehyde:ferredoxin oxidoreductase
MAIECYENGLITREDTGGIEMTWGNHKAIVAMTEKLARREGFGDILADGVKVAAERIGKGADKFAMHIQGQEFPAHDPKYGFNWAIAYKMDATPGRHCQGPGKPVDGLPLPPFDRMSQQGMQPGYKAGTNFMHVIQSLGQCIFVYWAMPNIEVQMDAIKTVTGWDVTFDELFLTGERINNMRHLFNLREGLNPLHFAYPDRMAGRPPREEGPLKGITLNEELLFGDYLKAMDWDPVTTRPSKKKLEELGLQDIVAKFWPE